MKRLRQLLELSWSDRASLAIVALLLLVARGGVRWMPLPRLHQRLARTVRVLPFLSLTPEQVIWAVETAGRHLGCTCLSQSLVAQVLLTRIGQSSRMVVGMASEDRLTGHAWVESEGRVLLGGSCERFAPMFVLEDARTQITSCP